MNSLSQSIHVEDVEKRSRSRNELMRVSKEVSTKSTLPPLYPLKEEKIKKKSKKKKRRRLRLARSVDNAKLIYF